MAPPLPQQDPVWICPKVDPNWVQTIVDEFHIHAVTAQILAARGFKTLEEIHAYLYAQLPSLFDPFLFPDMDLAVERISLAIKNKENILIYGDNDVDGISGTVLLTEFLRTVGASVFFYVSHRTSLKHSLVQDALDYAVKNQCKLLITVD
ncbi:MAG: single-stranded-DNA-specific exonuclease RecJ, partial [Chlamydiae bacterium]|nr:single-stranded-DNA-specific exonuclease RecJ [Chlamydiota bacterium]